MNKTISVIFSTLLLTGSVLATSVLADGHRNGGSDRMARMQQHLGLSDEQVQQMQAIRDDGGSREDMQAVLTAEQREKMEQHRASKGKGGDRLARMQKHLQLTDDQVEQMREIRANGGGRDEMQAVLTEEQRQQLEAHRQARGKRGESEPS
ncbi:hypothetical protein EYC98_05230 [Halieaceae bacterium IMCC14734]|uniref:Periplasmic heavy metal sensor n=1 Tax=Candidatus Litorirhabdus singularis TaxID=2518993 RepID=A0ABT3TEM2_9GAMM|nr:hypothetical protein [Candidatus Litorirhabdus singularis]MCX2980270.1 hypothetical protein [Candidatus Litorirhabdus singularis]